MYKKKEAISENEGETFKARLVAKGYSKKHGVDLMGFFMVVIVAKTAETTKKNLQNPSKDPLKHQIQFKTKEEGAISPCVSFKNRSNGWGNKDRSELSTRSASNNIHTKSGVDNL